MFKLSLSETYSWPVAVKLPVDGGKFITQTFDGVFKRLGNLAMKEEINRENTNDIEYAKNVLVGWTGITDDDGAEVPFSEAARDKLLDIAAVAAAVVEAHVLSASGQGVKRKN